MKKTLIALAGGMMLALTATTSQALTVLTVGDSFYLGSVDPGVGSPTTEAQLLNNLANLNSGQTTTIGGITYSRSTNTLCGFGGACVDANDVGDIGDDTVPIQSTGIPANDFTYLKAAYGNTMIVWYVETINDTVSIPTQCGSGSSGSTGCGGQSGGGLSHWILYNPTTTTVPDGGTTLSLLGLGMLGLGYLRSRRQS